jgi:glutathione S-transferase
MARKAVKAKKRTAGKKPARKTLTLKKTTLKKPGSKKPTGRHSSAAAKPNRKATAKPAARKRPAAKPTLHGAAPSAPTYKVALMLSLLGEPFAFRHTDLRSGAHKTPEFLAINRYGQVPALSDGELLLCQSGSILQHLAAKHKKFGGKDALQQARAREWLFWDADKLAPGVLRTRAAIRGFVNLAPEVTLYFRDHADSGLRVLEAQLGKSKFVAGVEPTIGDIACYGVLAFAKEGAFDLALYPNISAWMQRMESLPGFKPPYELLPLHDIA